MLPAEQKELTVNLSAYMRAIAKWHANSSSSHVISTYHNNYDVEFEDDHFVITVRYDDRPDKKLHFEPRVQLVAIEDEEWSNEEESGPDD